MSPHLSKDVLYLPKDPYYKVHKIRKKGGEGGSLEKFNRVCS